MTKREIADKIKQLRLDAGYRQKQLSILLNANTGYVSRLETRADFYPSLDILVRLCEIFNITLEEFFSGDVQKTRAYNRLNELLSEDAIIALSKCKTARIQVIID